MTHRTLEDDAKDIQAACASATLTGVDWWVVVERTTEDHFVLPESLIDGSRVYKYWGPARPEHEKLTLEQQWKARMMGHEAAVSLATWTEMGEKDAVSITEDIDPEVQDRYPGPNLSGELADSPTPQSIAEEVGWNAFEGDEYGQGVDQLSELWCEEADQTWQELLVAHAYRVLDRPEVAESIEYNVVARHKELTVEGYSYR